jgi:hypothetical protein
MTALICSSAMKTTILLVVAAVLTAFAPASVRAADDVYVAYEEGRAAFNIGQFEIAREKLNYVLSKAPDHLPTRAMLAQIEAKLGPNNTTLRKSYEKVVLEKVEFVDVSVEEALQALRTLSLRASQNKVSPNVIVKSPDVAKRTISLNLTQVPLTEVLNYVAQLSGSKVVYDKNAVVITNIGDVPVAPAPGAVPPLPSATGTPTTTRQALNRDSLQDPFSRKL